MSEIDFDAPEASYAMAKLVPRRTGLPMVVWITPNEGYPHDCRVKIARQHGDRGRWADSEPKLQRKPGASITVRPDQQLIGLPAEAGIRADDFQLAAKWVLLNQAVILEYWDGVLDDIGDVLARLQRI